MLMMMTMRNNAPQSLRRSKILIAIAVGIAIGCVFAFLFPDGLFSASSSSSLQNSLVKSSPHPAAGSSSCESSERLSLLKSEYASVSQKNDELRKEIRELTEKLTFAEQEYDNAQKQVLSLGKQAKAGPFGSVKGSRINPTVRLAKILEKVTVNRELIVALANSNVKEMLEVWFSNIKRVGIPPRRCIG